MPLVLLCYKRIKLQVNSLLVNDEETNGSGGEMEEAVEEEIEVFEQDVFLSMGKFAQLVNVLI